MRSFYTRLEMAVLGDVEALARSLDSQRVPRDLAIWLAGMRGCKRPSAILGDLCRDGLLKIEQDGFVRTRTPKPRHLTGPRVGSFPEQAYDHLAAHWLLGCRTFTPDHLRFDPERLARHESNRESREQNDAVRQARIAQAALKQRATIAAKNSLSSLLMKPRRSAGEPVSRWIEVALDVDLLVRASGGPIKRPVMMALCQRHRPKLATYYNVCSNLRTAGILEGTRQGKHGGHSLVWVVSPKALEAIARLQYEHDHSINGLFVCVDEAKQFLREIEEAR